jgi:hypothetical protein
MEKEYHVSNLGILVMNHGVLKRLQKVLLKFEMRQLFLLKKSHRKLTKRIQSKKSDVRVIVATNLSCISFLQDVARLRHTNLKCSPRISHRFDHSRRMRVIL